MIETKHSFRICQPVNFRLYSKIVLPALVALPIFAVLWETSSIQQRQETLKVASKTESRVHPDKDYRSQLLREVEKEMRKASDKEKRSLADKKGNNPAVVVKKKASKKDKAAKTVTKNDTSHTKKGDASASTSVFEEALHVSLLEEASRLAFNSEKPWRDLIRVAIAQWNFGWKEEAQSTFDIAADLAVDPDQPESGSQALADVVRGLLRAKLVYRAIDTVERIPESEAKDEARAEIVVTLAHRGRIQDLRAAERIAANMTNRNARKKALVQLAEIKAYHHGAKAGLETLEEIHDLTDKSKGMQKVATSLIKRQDFESAYKVIDNIPEATTRDDSLMRLSTVRARRHEFNIALDIAQTISNQKFFDRALNQIAIGEARAHESNRAILTASQIQDEFFKARTFEQILRAEARSGRLRSAIKLSGLIDDDHTKDRALGDIASEVTAKVGARNGRKIAQLSNGPEERDRALRLVAITSAKTGHSKEAIETAKQIRKPKERLLAFAKIADDRSKRAEFAFSILKNEELLLKRVVLDESPELKRPISMAFASNGEASEALKVLEKLPNLSQRDHGYRDLARLFGRQQKLAKGVEAVDKISNARLKKQAQSELISALARSTPPEEALGALKKFNSTTEKVDFLIKVLDRI